MWLSSIHEVTGGVQRGPQHSDADEQSILGQGVEGGSNISALPVIVLLSPASALAGRSSHCQPGIKYLKNQRGRCFVPGDTRKMEENC